MIAPTPDGLFQLKSYTSREGMGGTLLQKQGDEWVVIGYHSKRLPKSAKNFGVTELELTGILGFISKLVARPEYGTIYQHKGMLLQNLHRRYLYIVIRLPHLSDLEQRIPNFLNCDNYSSLTASNPDPLLDDTPTNDNELHQVICNTFKINYF